MENVLEKIKKFRDSARLTPSEHRQMDQAVMAFVDANPEKKINTSNIMKFIPSEPTPFWFQSLGRKFAYAAMLLVIILGVGGGTAFASNSALPGDLLYPVKVNFTEEVQAAMKLSDKAKAQWAAERIARRLDEVRQLVAVLNTVNPKVLVDMQANVKRYGKDTVSAAQYLDTATIDGIAKQLQQATASYNETLSLVSGNDMSNENGIALNTIRADVEKTKNQTNLIAVSMFANERDAAIDTQKTVGALTISSPQAGYKWVSGEFKTISWQSIPDAKSYEVTVIYSDGKMIGLIGGRSPYAPEKLESDILWPANYHDGIYPKLNHSPLNPGAYKIRVRVDDWNGNIFVGETGVFFIVAPDTNVEQIEPAATGNENSIGSYPQIKVNMEDVLPDTISASADSGQSILFARASITPDDGIIFNQLKLSCSGDSRAFKGSYLKTSNGITGEVKIIPTYGGFELEVDRQDMDLKISKDESVTVSLFLHLLPSEYAIKFGAEFPRKISCGPQTVSFISERSGSFIPFDRYSINALTALRAFKTTLVK